MIRSKENGLTRNNIFEEFDVVNGKKKCRILKALAKDMKSIKLPPFKWTSKCETCKLGKVISQ